jgi:ABC-type Mn2+/Zn2+ transport system ATPase subunit
VWTTLLLLVEVAEAQVDLLVLAEAAVPVDLEQEQIYKLLQELHTRLRLVLVALHKLLVAALAIMVTTLQ